ncbi:MAG TPA: M48 family metallopeptidase [Candidatus Binatia bacterium]
MKNHWRLIVFIQIFILVGAFSNAAALRNDRRQFKDSTGRSEQQMQRLQAIMFLLLRVTDHPMAREKIQVSIVDDKELNAASAGNGQFYVTTALMNQATDEQLRGVLAHEIAHEDLGHPMKAQVLGVGLGLGAALLEKIFPGSSAVAPIAGTIIAGQYTRPMELAADRHAVILLRRAGYPKETMIDTLTWLMRRNGNSGGGILASHPATSERIQALRAVR